MLKTGGSQTHLVPLELSNIPCSYRHQICVEALDRVPTAVTSPALLGMHELQEGVAHDHIPRN